METIQITDIIAGKPKAIAINFLFKNATYNIPDWTVHITFLNKKCEKIKRFCATIKGSSYSTFYLSEIDTLNLYNNEENQNPDCQIVTNSTNSQSLYYEVNLVKKDELEDEYNEMEVPLFKGTVEVKKECQI
jgi:hypothetical protein